MNEPNPQTSVNGFFRKYKELIITTIICLFLTGIYDSINNQTAEIKKWYELMIGIKETVKAQTNNLDRLQENLENHIDKTDFQFRDHNDRIRILEFEVIPYKSQMYPSHTETDSTYAKNY